MQFSDSGPKDTHVITFLWGDGTSDSVRDSSNSEYRSSVTAIHSYGKIGSYSVIATVRDNDGGTSSRTAAFPVIVFDPAERTSVNGYDVLDLGTLGGNSATPRDFNSHDQIVGSSLTSSGQTHAFLWENATMRDLGTVEHDGSEAIRIDANGIIGGTVWRQLPREADHDRGQIAAIWRNGLATVLDSTKRVRRLCSQI